MDLTILRQECAEWPENPIVQIFHCGECKRSTPIELVFVNGAFIPTIFDGESFTMKCSHCKHTHDNSHITERDYSDGQYVRYNCEKCAVVWFRAERRCWVCDDCQAFDEDVFCQICEYRYDSACRLAWRVEVSFPFRNVEERKSEGLHTWSIPAVLDEPVEAPEVTEGLMEKMEMERKDLRYIASGSGWETDSERDEYREGS